MATNLYMDEGRYLNVAASYPATPVSGTPVVFGSIPGVALTDEGKGGNAAGQITMDTEGVYMLPISGAITAGAIVYFITGTGLLTATAGSNVRFGYALAAGEDVVIPIKLGY